jgi:heme/copper-type cytochrome/quinol oxidase subunit 2
MATSPSSPPTSAPTPAPLTPEQIAARKAQERQIRNIIFAAVAFLLVVVAALGAAVYFLMRPETSTEEVARLRDVFIIVVALETLVIGAALVILLIQLASLINLLQNEVRPILEATSETVNTLRGTAQFLGENVVEPVIKLNTYLASIQRVLELMGLKKK